MSTHTKFMVVILLGIWLLQAAACQPAPKPIREEVEVVEEATEEVATEAPTTAAGQPAAKTPEKPNFLPGEVPEAERTLQDSDAGLRAYEKRVLSGDDFTKNLFERPFTSEEMIYQPELDIYTVDFASDENFFYFTIHLNGLKVERRGFSDMYAIEFDRTKTGRGDLIVFTGKLQLNWSIKNVRAFADINVDVGGPTPIIADEGFVGTGYDQPVALGGDKVAFSRISPEDENAVEIAVSKALLDDPEEFLWGAWVDDGIRKLVLFDYNDSMGLSEAGSPFIDDADYPIKDLYSLDNTCRLPYGFEQLGSSVPGMCITTAAAAEPEKEAPGCTLVCTDWCAVGDRFTCCGEWICQ
jgi:hypothetical protein